MSLRFIRITHAAIVSSLLILLLPCSHAAEQHDRDAQVILHMLDYVSVDYGATVLLGKVLNENEFNEQIGFTEQAAKLLGAQPEHPRRAALVMEALELAHSVRTKSPPEQVSAAAQQLRRAVIDIYHVPVSPRAAPALTTALAIFQRECASCHGPQGHGDGPDGLTLNPRPADFHNAARMNQRSVYGLYNTITLGVAGTAMAGYPKLSDDERWALAFLASNMRTSPERISQGRQFWEQRDFRGSFPDLIALTTLTSDQVAARHGDHTRAVFDYLRATPQALTTSRHNTLLFATEQLDNALTHYRNGDQKNALRSAIAAYLEGFEPVELSLDTLDDQLRRDIEQEMLTVRQRIDDNMPAEKIAQQIDRVKVMLNQADELLRAGKLSVGSAFTSSMFIVLREGLEGILLLTAIVALVVKSGQHNALAYIHAGWGSAVLLGLLTWVATWLIDISGTSREITGGTTALIASAMLIYVGFWLHDKAHVQSWRNFMRNQSNIVLRERTLWALALISFIAVYRELIEAVLFYQALWAQTDVHAWSGLWGGMLMGALMLAAISWSLFRFGIKLSLGSLLAATSILLAILAVVFVGQGVASLQEANLISRNVVNFISLPVLGIFPTFQTLLAQVSVIGILILCYGLATRPRTAGDDPETSRT